MDCLICNANPRGDKCLNCGKDIDYPYDTIISGRTYDILWEPEAFVKFAQEASISEFQDMKELLIMAVRAFKYQHEYQRTLVEREFKFMNKIDRLKAKLKKAKAKIMTLEADIDLARSNQIKQSWKEHND